MEHLKIKKRRVTLNMYDNNFSCKVYYGRLLGLIDDQEFAAMISDPDLQKKCMTKGAKPLSDITDNWYDLSGFRMVVALRKVDGVDVNKRLLITERLGLVSFVSQEEGKNSLEVGITAATGEDDSYILLHEEEECT